MVNSAPFLNNAVMRNWSSDCSVASDILPISIPTKGVKPISAPMAKTITVKNSALEKLTAARSTVAYLPTMMESNKPTSDAPNWVSITGSATFRLRL